LIRQWNRARVPFSLTPPPLINMAFPEGRFGMVVVWDFSPFTGQALLRLFHIFFWVVSLSSRGFLRLGLSLNRDHKSLFFFFMCLCSFRWDAELKGPRTRSTVKASFRDLLWCASGTSCRSSQSFLLRFCVSPPLFVVLFLPPPRFFFFLSIVGFKTSLFYSSPNSPFRLPNTFPWIIKKSLCLCPSPCHLATGPSV